MSSCRSGEALGRVTAAPVWALRSSPAYDASAMDGIAVRAADTLGATETSPRSLPAHAVVDTGDPLPEGFDAVVMREHVHWEGGVPEVRAAAAPWQHVRTIGEDVSATELLLPEGHRLRAVDLAAAAAAGHVPRAVRRAPRVVVDPDRRRDRAAGERPGAGAAARHERADARGAGDARRGARRSAVAIVPDDPERIADAVREAAAAADLVVVIAGSSAGATTTRRRWSSAPGGCSCTASRSSPGIPSCSARSAGRRCWARPATRSRPR